MEVRRKKGINITKNIIQCWIIVILFFLAVSGETRKEIKKISIEVHEGTELAFDLSPDGETIVFDLLGQIWLLPAEGGEARAITDSVKENAEHLYPTFAADGNRIIFWNSRPNSWGLTSINLSAGERRNLTELLSSYSDSYNDRFHAYSQIKKKIVFIRGKKLMLIDEKGGAAPSELEISGLRFPRGVTDPAWAPDGSRIAFVNSPANYTSHSGGRLWQVGAEGGAPEPLTSKNQEIRAPAYSPDGQYIAYFFKNKDLAFELRIQKLDGGEARKIVENEDITPLRLCWFPEGSDLLYCAEGRLWKISVEGGHAREIPFKARLSFVQKSAKLKTVQFPMAGEGRLARGHMGLEISPDGQKIAAIALTKLWIWNVGEKPEAVVKLPVTASGVCWSPDVTEVAWSAGPCGNVNLFATNIETGITRRLTDIPGSAVKPSWSPDGKHIAFIHRKNHEIGGSFQFSYESLRVFRVSEAPITDLDATIRLQMYPMYGKSVILSFGFYWGYPWTPDSKWLLGEGRKPTLISVDKKVRLIKDSLEIPSGLKVPLLESDGSLLYNANYALWRVPFDTQIGICGEPIPVTQEPAIYPSVARDGKILFVSKDGLRLRKPNGQMENLGWPLSYETAAMPEPLLISNVRIIDGVGSDISPLCDILIEEGRISRIGPQDQIKANQNITVIEGEGRTVIPGMIDAHVHIWRQNMLSGLLYEGITTVRDMGTLPAWIKGFQELIEAGIQSGPRIVLGGFQLHPSFIDPPIPVGSGYPWGEPNGEAGVARVLSLAKAFDLDHIKMYLPVNSFSGAKFIDMAHELGFPVSSHLGYPLPLVAAGINSKEHTIDLKGVLGPRVGGAFYEDIVQIIKEGRIGIVPTISFTPRSLAVREESQIKRIIKSPFYSVGFPPDRALSPAAQMQEERSIIIGRENVAKLHRAGVLIAAGTDTPFNWMPWSLHMELEEYVRAGLSPLEAILTATKNAARILRAEKDIGTIEEGKLADLIILDANPLEDIRNTRKIWMVIKGGKVVDREALENWMKHEAEEVASIGK